MSIYFLKHVRATNWFPFVFALSLLWSPWISLGLSPLFLVPLLRSRSLREYRSFLNLPNVAGAILTALFAAYYLAKVELRLPEPIREKSGVIYSMLDLSGNGDAWMFAWKAVLFLLLEVGVFAILFWISRCRENAADRSVLFAYLLMVLVMANFQYGTFNDFFMRVSIPAIFVFGYLLHCVIFDRRNAALVRLAAIGAFLIGTATPALQMIRHSNEYPGPGRHLPAQPLGLSELDRGIESVMGGRFFYQYVGSADAVFFRYLARD